MATIRDVAERARVSPITVSRVINEIGPVKDETRLRVLQAIDELNYVPNQQARSLRSRRTHTLALLITDVTNPFWTTVARGVEDKATENNFSVILCNTDEDVTKEQRYVKVVLEKRVDGVIAAPASYESAHLRQLCEQHIPLVLIDRRLDRLDVDIVLCENLATSDSSPRSSHRGTSASRSSLDQRRSRRRTSALRGIARHCRKRACRSILP